MPTLHTILLDLLYAGATAAIAYLAPRAKAFIDAHTTTAERQTLEGIASAVVPYVEREYAALGGPQKMGKAIEFAANALRHVHSPLSLTDIESAIERAYADATAKGLLKVYQASAKSAKKAADPMPLAQVVAEEIAGAIKKKASDKPAPNTATATSAPPTA